MKQQLDVTKSSPLLKVCIRNYYITVWRCAYTISHGSL